jgi:four helix bundle protein
MIRRDGPAVQKSIAFSIATLKYCEFLMGKRKFIISNIFEAQYAESRTDFIHKMKIAQKEANETLYWLILCENLEKPEIQQEMITMLDEILAILSKIITTSKKKLNQ